MGKKWSPSFISKLGKLASKVYREVYKKEPPYKQIGDDPEPVNVYPYGILVQAYRRLIAAGEQIGEPYRAPYPASEPKESSKDLPPTNVRPSFTHARSKEIIAERLAKIAAGWQPPEPPAEDMEQDDEIY